jgi:serine/threonine protein kinase
MANLIGMMLGNYRVLQLIGTGGMGEVYLAEDARLNRQVAIKVLRIEYSELDTDREATRLFQREGKAIARLEHPNILPLFEYGEHNANGISLTYLVMPYRQEGSLANWLQKRSSTILTPQDVAHLVTQAANALQFAHDHNIIHRDVKPSNFLITNDRGDNPNRPNIQLADFGIAKLTTASANTGTSIIGTPLYMAPEQWQGQPVPATDQYALAIMAYELLVGHPPFKGRLETMLYEHLLSQPVPPSKFNAAISTDIDQVILQALAKRPSDRFGSIAKFAQALEIASQSQLKPLPIIFPPQIKHNISEKNSPIPSTQPQSAEELALLRAQLQADQPLPLDNATGYEYPPPPPPPPNSAGITYPGPARPEQSSSPFRGFLMAALAVLMATAHLIITFIQAANKWFQRQVVQRVKSFIRLVNLWFRQQVIPLFKSPVSSVSGQIQPQGQPSTITSYTVSPDLLPNPSTMQFTESALPADELKDFFISYNRKDEEVAEWIAWQLEDAGYSTIMPKWDFRPGSNFEMEMRKARAKTKRTIVVLSPDYLKARNSMAEWSHVFQQHTTGGQDILLPVCARDCGPKLKKLLGSMVYIDLVGKDRPKALELLLAHVRGERIKPKIEPEYVVRPTTEPANLADILFATINLSKPRKPEDTGKSIPATPVDTPVRIFTQEQKIQQAMPDTPEEAAQHQQAPIPVEQQVEQTVRRMSGVVPSTDQQVDTEPAVKGANTEPVVKSTELAAKGIEIFFSYSHKDEELRNELDEHLSTLKQLKLITAWHDKEIGAGKNWAHEIDKRLSKACIILLLVSPSFMASRYCYSIEMNKAMERHEAGEALVIPILIRPVDWEDAPFDKLQMLPKGAKAVTKWLNRDEAFEDIAKSIRMAVNELNAKIPNQ